MLPEAAGRGQHFQARGHSFSLYGPTLSRQITYLFISCSTVMQTLDFVSGLHNCLEFSQPRKTFSIA